MAFRTNGVSPHPTQGWTRLAYHACHHVSVRCATLSATRDAVPSHSPVDTTTAVINRLFQRRGHNGQHATSAAIMGNGLWQSTIISPGANAAAGCQARQTGNHATP